MDNVLAQKFSEDHQHFAVHKQLILFTWHYPLFPAKWVHACCHAYWAPEWLYKIIIIITKCHALLSQKPQYAKLHD